MEWKGREGSEGKLQYQYPVAQAFCALLYSGCDGKTPEIPHHLDRGPGGESTGKADSFSPSLTKKKKLPDPTPAKTAPISYSRLS